VRSWSKLQPHLSLGSPVPEQASIESRTSEDSGQAVAGKRSVMLSRPFWVLLRLIYNSLRSPAYSICFGEHTTHAIG
jgi:hypothetical protein